MQKRDTQTACVETRPRHVAVLSHVTKKWNQNVGFTKKTENRTDFLSRNRHTTNVCNSLDSDIVQQKINNIKNWADRRYQN